MAMVTVDDRGRMTISKEFGIKKTRAIIIPAGSFFVTIPLPTKPQEHAGSWLPTKLDRKELKALAENPRWRMLCKGLEGENNLDD